ncbi:MAG: M48 family metalloprotease [Oligoflexia bacterium]|nr:M48 family metalloprotease [Oligoflexia bacterium]
MMPPEAVAQIDNLSQNAMPLTGIIVLMLIPLTAYALWGDYFERYIGKLREDQEEFQEIEELTRVRLNGLFAVLAEAVIFLGSAQGDPSAAAPHPFGHLHAALRGLFGVGTIISLMLLQARYERCVRNDQGKGAAMAHFKSAARACLWSLLGGAIYLAVFAAGMLVCTAPAAIFKLPQSVAVFLLLSGMAVGVVGGLCASFGIAPVLVRKIFGAEKISDAKIVAELDKVFDASAVARPGYWMIGVKQYHPANAMVAGFRAGTGLLRPGLFISKSAIDALSLDELRAIVFHEISHIRLGHLKKRFIFSSGLVICASLFTGTTVEVIQAVTQQNSLAAFSGCIALVASFAISIRALAEQTRYQEVQADIHSIETLGSNLKDLSSALRKLDKANGILPLRKEPGSMMVASGHPATELRVKILAKYFELRREKKAAEEETRNDQAA